MRVKIGDTWYDSKEQPIMIELGLGERLQIGNMSPTANKYCAYPDTVPTNDIIHFMELDPTTLYPVSVNFAGLESTNNDFITLVGNNCADKSPKLDN